MLQLHVSAEGHDGTKVEPVRGETPPGVFVAALGAPPGAVLAGLGAAGLRAVGRRRGRGWAAAAAGARASGLRPLVQGRASAAPH